MMKTQNLKNVIEVLTAYLLLWFYDRGSTGYPLSRGWVCFKDLVHLGACPLR